MCTGAEFLAAAQATALAVGAYSTYAASRLSPMVTAPLEKAVVKTDPVQDDTEAQAKSAQDAALAKLVTRERSRANSLLSQAGGAGDPTGAPLGRAEGKPTFGS